MVSSFKSYRMTPQRQTRTTKAPGMKATIAGLQKISRRDRLGFLALARLIREVARSGEVGW